MKELRERLEEAESAGVRKLKAQVSAMESRISALEEERDMAQSISFLYIYSSFLFLPPSLLSSPSSLSSLSPSSLPPKGDNSQIKRTMRHQEKKLKEYAGAIEDERKQAEQYKQVNTNKLYYFFYRLRSSSHM